VSNNRRTSERIPILGDLHGEVKVFQPITIKELSARGAQVESRFPLHVDSLYEFRLAHGERAIGVKGRVSHSRISEVDQDLVFYRSGIEFIETSPRVGAAITDFLDLLTRSREPPLHG
jgi:hypothetical protein